MLTVYIAVAMLLVVALTGAPLKRLAELRIRHVWLLWVALADQILVISIIPDTHPTALAVAHIASYAVAAVCLWLNRRLPGIRFIGAGGLLNGVTITLNGGTLPASASALQSSGHAGRPASSPTRPCCRTRNWPSSATSSRPRPGCPATTCSASGTSLIWLGLAWLLWRTCRPARRVRYAPRHAATVVTA